MDLQVVLGRWGFRGVTSVGFEGVEAIENCLEGVLLRIMRAGDCED
jgi:hypothetical protein